MIGTLLDIFKALCTSILGIILLAAAIEAWFLHWMNILERLFAIGASILLISPTLLTDLAGFSVAAVLFIYQRGKSSEVDQRAFYKLGKLDIITSRYVLFLVVFIITIILTYFVFLLISKKKGSRVNYCKRRVNDGKSSYHGTVFFPGCCGRGSYCFSISRAHFRRWSGS